MTEIVTPAVTVTQELIDTLVTLGGYTHPLFHPPAEARAAGATAPLMGQGVLLLAGGLVERSGHLDHAIALLGFEEVRFHSMVRAGRTLRVRLAEGPARETSDGRLVQRYVWTVVDDADEPVLVATALMLTHRKEGKAQT